MAESKTAKKSAPRKSKTGFEWSGDCPRFIPLANGEHLFRDPSTGNTRRVTDLLSVLAEFEGHGAHPQMVSEAEALADVNVASWFGDAP